MVEAAELTRKCLTKCPVLADLRREAYHGRSVPRAWIFLGGAILEEIIPARLLSHSSVMTTIAIATAMTAPMSKDSSNGKTLVTLAGFTVNPTEDTVDQPA